MWRYLCLLLNSDQVSCEQLAEAGDILGKQRKSEPQQPVAHSAVSGDFIRFLVQERCATLPGTWRRWLPSASGHCLEPLLLQEAP